LPPYFHDYACCRHYAFAIISLIFAIDADIDAFLPIDMRYLPPLRFHAMPDYAAMPLPLSSPIIMPFHYAD
jgi:hypothetical protein